MKYLISIVAVSAIAFVLLNAWKFQADQDAQDSWEKYITGHSMQELNRLLALNQQQIISGCRYVAAGQDGDYIITLHPEESHDYVLGSVTVSVDGRVISNSLPDNLTFGQLMALTKEAKDWQKEGRRVCQQTKK